MIRSMTGFGRAEMSDQHRKLTVEMKAVNNRYLDLNIRMPKKYAFLDSKVRGILKTHVARGKVDVFITEEAEGESSGRVLYNGALAREYEACYAKIAEEFHIPNDVTASKLAQAPEVLTLGEDEEDEAELWENLEKVLTDAVQSFNVSRTEEGERLKRDLLEKLSMMDAYVDRIIEHEPEIQKTYREHLEESLKEILEDRSVDDSQITAACVIYADKICTDEETVRLKSHIRQMKDELEKEESIGRKLDFLAQEMNREANTTLSKAGDLVTSDLGIELKTMIEKIREQIQNIE